MRLPLSLAAGALLVVGGATAVATAQTDPSDAPPAQSQSGQHLSRLDRLAILLDLTDTQKLQVQQVLQEQREQMRAQLRQLRLQWQQSRAAGQRPDFAQLRTAREQLRQQTLAKLQPLLSADQYRKIQLLLPMPAGPRWHHRGTWGAPPADGSPSSSGPAGAG